ncbi:diacylglycerol/lipid kinase family protein [Plastoroseomonas arctica]|uniref:Diacylglycerol kinase family lipid kinase n=1 Tax=Plastoroseomonas arctica TaxID=1509237 RepID=A0AAF1JWQ7_9PROT|nr:diacylglycerol kinase family protein [Plastoroseomonas arctica]MBR0654188.1 diacylglycerol kinase family lipid kinase [Plastoroseomonas arctica]
MLVVFNPAAGARRRRRLTRALDTMLGLGMRPELAETAGPGDAERLARDGAARGEALVIAAGGDGTIAEVASGIAGSDASLGVLPLGTANVLAWEMGLAMRPEDAAGRLASGRMVELRPGLARFSDGRARLFVQMLGAGFDAAVVRDLDTGLKRRIGKGAYVLETLRQLHRYQFPRITVDMDGEIHHATSAIITKGRLYAGRYRLAPEAKQGEPGFHVALFSARGWLSTAVLGAALPLNLLPSMPGVRLLRASRVSLTGEGVPVQADGDAAGTLGMTVADMPGPLRLIGA